MKMTRLIFPMTIQPSGNRSGGRKKTETECTLNNNYNSRAISVAVCPASLLKGDVQHAHDGSGLR